MLLQLPLGSLHLPVLIQVKSAESLRTIRTDRKIRCVGQPTHLISFWTPFALRRFSRPSRRSFAIVAANLNPLKTIKALEFILKIGATHEIDQSVAGVRGHNLIVMGG